VLETLFPGISNELITAGAVTGDRLHDGRWFIEGACHVRFASGSDGLVMSRPVLEATVRERVRQLPNVVFCDNCGVSGLASRKGLVTGVEMREGVLAANLVIDGAFLFRCCHPTSRDSRLLFSIHAEPSSLK
jgi:hypothetical protein